MASRGDMRAVGAREALEGLWRPLNAHVADGALENHRISHAIGAYPLGTVGGGLHNERSCRNPPVHARVPIVLRETAPRPRSASLMQEAEQKAATLAAFGAIGMAVIGYQAARSYRLGVYIEPAPIREKGPAIFIAGAVGLFVLGIAFLDMVK